MNVINVKVDFTKRQSRTTGVNLTEGDYNSTKMVFEFDRDDGTKVLEMVNPSGDLVYLGEIINNEVVLVRKVDVTTKHNDITYIKYLDVLDNVYWYDKENNKLYDDNWQEIVSFNLDDYTKQTKDVSLFNESGNFIFEISLYDGDSKLTSASGKLKVLPEQVSIDGEIVETYLPIFDELIADINEAIDKTNNLNVTASKVGTTTTITVTDKNGTQSTTQVLDGEKGDAAIVSIGSTTTGDAGTNANVTNTGTSTNAVFNFTIPKGDKGDAGENGTNGVDGYSPTASVTKSGSTALISITDKNGTTTASISDGTNGTNGTDGEDGYSPTATVTKTGKIATITITDVNGTTTTQISDGADGTGSGDMSRATYDTNDNGIVDNAEKVNNHTVETDVPANAVFTDTIYDDSEIKGLINNKYSKPLTGIPKTDLASDVQTSLDKADTALQDHQDISGKQDIIQYSTMPTASASNLGKIYQYIGTTTLTSPIYTQGHFYIAVENSGTYSWQEISFGGSCNITEVDIATDSINFYEYDQGLYLIKNTGAKKAIKIFNGSTGNPSIDSNTKAFMLITNYYVSAFSTYYKQIILFGDNIYNKYEMSLNGGKIAYGDFATIYSNENSTNAVLSIQNTKLFVPTSNFHPATKISSETVPLTLSGLSVYSTSETYSEGDYVYKSATNLSIYKCNTTISTPEQWNSSHWTGKTYLEYMSDMLIGDALGGSY